MALVEFYPLIKAAHVGLALTSGALFAARGLGALMGARWPLQPLARRGSQLIDSGLLLAALLLLTILQFAPLGMPWLQLKLGLLVAYIVLGTLALRGSHGQTARLVAYVAALACFTAMVTLAMTRDPMGFLRAH